FRTVAGPGVRALAGPGVRALAGPGLRALGGEGHGQIAGTRGDAGSTSPVVCGVWGGTSTSSAAGCEPAGEEHVPAAASAEESAAAESLSELLPESCSGSEAPHPAGSTRARTARAADSMRAGGFGRW